MEEFNLALPPPIQSSESISLGLKLTKYFNIMYKQCFINFKHIAILFKILSQLLSIYSEQYYVTFLAQFCIHILNYYTPFSQILKCDITSFHKSI